MPELAAPVERYRGTSWEPVPEHQVPVVVLQLLAAVLLAAKTDDDQPRPLIQQTLLPAA